MATDFEETVEVETGRFRNTSLFGSDGYGGDVFLSYNISGCVPGVNCTEVEDPSNWREMERLVRIIVPTVFGLIFLLGLIGNTLVILVVVSDKNMRNTTNILILALAVADLLFVVFCVPFTAAQYAMSVWPFGSVWCKIVQYLIYVSAYASVYTLVLMSLDRYLAVVHAIRSMSIRNERNTWLAVVITWTIIIFGHVPLLLQHDVFHYPHMGENRSACVNTLHIYYPDTGKVYHACFLAFGYVIPLGAVCFMYGFMLRRLHGATPGGSQSQESMRTKRKVTRMVVVIVMIFAICWLPIQIILLLTKLQRYPDGIPYVVLQFSSNCLAYMNSCVNPILYAFLSENFRRSFRKFLCCASPRGRHPEYELVSVRQTENVTLLTQNNKKRSLTN